MFSFRKDKVGFFSGLTLIITCGGTFIATLVLLIVGGALGDWRMFVSPIRWVLFGWWIGCITTVLTRVYIFRYQMNRRASLPPPLAEAESNGQGARPDALGLSSSAVAAEAEVVRARAELERYRAIGAVGVSYVLGISVALAIVSFLASDASERIVAWSVGAPLMAVVVVFCVIALWPGDPRRTTSLPAAPSPSPSLPAATGIQEKPSQP